MHIIVPIKQVPETNAVRLDEQTGTMIRENVEAIVNPLDLYSIEAALRLRETYGGTVTAISMGPPQAQTALREVVAMGCDDAVLLSDKAFAGSDTWATGYVLSTAIRRLGQFDLICCGERATDGDTGQVGPGIAAFLDLPVVTYVGGIDEIADGQAALHRVVEEGVESLSVTLPAVITVVKEVAVPRLPTLRGKQRSRRIDMPTWGVKDLDLDIESVGLAGSPTRVVSLTRPKVARGGTKIAVAADRSAEQTVDELMGFLTGKGLI